eukprot:Lankesteria_metandrocarpae@DN5483_c0_g1_i12.p1
MRLMGIVFCLPVLQFAGSCSAVRHGNLNVPRDGVMPMENVTSVSVEMFDKNYFPSTEASVLPELGQLFLDGIMPMENETSVSEEMFDGKYFPDSYRSRSRSPRRRSTLPVATNGLPVGINEAHVNYMDSHRSRSRSPRRGSTLPISQSTEASCSPELWNLFLDAVENEPVTSNAKNMPDTYRSRSRSPRRGPVSPTATNPPVKAFTSHNRSPSRCRQEVTGSTGKIKKVRGYPDGENKSEVARAMLSHACGKEYPDGCTQGYHIYTCIGPHSRNAVVHEYDTRFAVTPQEYTSTQYFEYRHFGKPNAKTLAYLAACYAANRDDRKPVTGREIKIRVDNTGGNLLYRYRPNQGKCYGFSRHSFGDMGAWVLVHKTKWFRFIAQTPADWLVNTQG